MQSGVTGLFLKLQRLRTAVLRRVWNLRLSSHLSTFSLAFIYLFSIYFYLFIFSLCLNVCCIVPMNAVENQKCSSCVFLLLFFTFSRWAQAEIITGLRLFRNGAGVIVNYRGGDVERGPVWLCCVLVVVVQTELSGVLPGIVWSCDWGWC